MSEIPRLSNEALHLLPGNIKRPGYDRSQHGAGIVHIGVGAFHKAHQAVYTDSAMANSGGDWMISGISLRSKTAQDQLMPQDCLYAVNVQDGHEDDLRIIGSIKDVRAASDELERCIALIAEPDIHVVSLTITEKGYGLDPDRGLLDFDDPDIAHDIQNPGNPKSAIGFLCAGLTKRREARGNPLTIVSCDNLSANGKKLEGAVAAFLKRGNPDTAAWVTKHVRFPSTMVDRIVPATTDADRKSTTSKLGLSDEACVKTEPFSQWVIENNFAGPVPDWASAGALLVDDVSQFELAKLRLLNGPHSAIAYVGSLAGHEFVHEVMADERLADFVTRLMEEEIKPMVPQAAGLDLEDYTQALRQRFANSALQHRLLQIAADGSQKLPQRIVPVLQQRLAENLPVHRLTITIAAWFAYMTGWGYQGGGPKVDDPAADEFRLIAEANKQVPDFVRAALGKQEIFGDVLYGDQQFCSDLTDTFATMISQDVAQVLEEI